MPEVGPRVSGGGNQASDQSCGEEVRFGDLGDPPGKWSRYLGVVVEIAGSFIADQLQGGLGLSD